MANDGTPLSDAPRSDAESETLKNVPKKPEIPSQDIIVEIVDYLRSAIPPGHEALIRFDKVNPSVLTSILAVLISAPRFAQTARCRAPYFERP